MNDHLVRVGFRLTRSREYLASASGKPAIRSRMEIGDFSGTIRLPRRTMNVCSRAYWPVRQAWLVVSVKQIQLEYGGNSQ